MRAPPAPFPFPGDERGSRTLGEGANVCFPTLILSFTRRRRSVGLYEYKTPEDVPVELRHQLHRGLFPPTSEEVSKWNLHHCMRIMPQDMNTGGFFVTVFKKLKPVGSVKKKQQHLYKAEGGSEAAPATTTTTPTEPTKGGDVSDDDGGGSKKVPGFGGRKRQDGGAAGPAGGGQQQQQQRNVVANQQFVPVTDDFYLPVKEFYGLKDTAPRGQLFARTEAAKSVMFITKSVKAIMDADARGRLKVVHSGVQAFERNSKNRSVCAYRIHHEGMQTVVPHLTEKRKELVGPEDFSTVVKHSLKSNQHQIDCRQFSAALQSKLSGMGQGCFVMVLSSAEGRISDKLMLTMWKNTAASCHSLVSKVDLEGVKSRMVGQGLWVEVELVEEYMQEKIRKERSKELEATEEEKEGEVKA